jgi:hypothetical protein
VPQVRTVLEVHPVYQASQVLQASAVNQVQRALVQRPPTS